MSGVWFDSFLLHTCQMAQTMRLSHGKVNRVETILVSQPFAALNKHCTKSTSDASKRLPLPSRSPVRRASAATRRRLST
jgi:hypothetical protein